MTYNDYHIFVHKLNTYLCSFTFDVYTDWAIEFIYTLSSNNRIYHTHVE